MSNNYKSNVKRYKKLLTDEEHAALKTIGVLLSKAIKAKAKKRKKGGMLKKSIKYKLQPRKKAVIVGIKKKGFYGGFLELGTKNIKEESFIMSTVEEKKDEIQKIIMDHLKAAAR